MNNYFSILKNWFAVLIFMNIGNVRKIAHIWNCCFVFTLRIQLGKRDKYKNNFFAHLESAHNYGHYLNIGWTVGESSVIQADQEAFSVLAFAVV